MFAMSCRLVLALISGADTGAAGKSTPKPDALVQQALESEVVLDFSARDKLLTFALEAEPAFSSAHWHKGELRWKGAWQTPEAVAMSMADDADYIRYRKKRGQLPAELNKAQHVLMANWGEKEGQAEVRAAHLRAALRLDPSDAELAKRVTTHREKVEEAAREKAVRKEIETASRAWRQRLVALRRQLGQSKEKDKAEADLAAITDPLAIPALEELFSLESDDLALRTVAIVGRMPHQAATLSLVRHVIDSNSEEVRNDATARLAERPFEYSLPPLIAALQPSGSSNRGFVIFGRNVAIPIWQWDSFTTSFVDEPLPVTGDLALGRRARANDLFPPELRLLSVLGRDQSVQNRIADAETSNERRISRVGDSLRTITGQSISNDQIEWQRWFANVRGAYFDSEASAEPTTTQTIVLRTIVFSEVRGASCFASGTLVWTLSGPQPIENVFVGELVLSQNAETGELAYKPVVRRTIMPPMEMIAMSIGSETIHATKPHPFWVSGKGWVTARDLADQTPLRTASAMVKVGIAPGKKAPAYNLEVADFSTYFVGKEKLLTHDITAIRGLPRAVPGLAPLALEK